MKISVAIATYNGENYIEEQLDSVLHQTRQVDEVIICDDRSSDKTMEVVKTFLERNKLKDTWKIFLNEKNLGYASNFVGAMRKTTGDYVMFCDQDDIWIETRVEDMIQAMEKNPKVLLMGSEFETFSTSENALQVPKWELARFTNDKSMEQLKFTAPNVFIGCQGCTMCVRRSFLDAIDKYWYEGWAHDEFVWKLALCMEGLYFFHSVTLKRRLHAGNVSLGKKRDQQKRIKFLEELLESHRVTIQFGEDIGMEKKKIRLLERNIKATNLRIELLRDKKYFNTLKLIVGYMDCYHKRRAIPVELYMAMRS